MSYSQKELKQVLKDYDISITTSSLHNYEKTYKVISTAKRGAGVGGKWTNYEKIHLLEVLVAWCMMNKPTQKIIDLLLSEDVFTVNGELMQDDPYTANRKMFMMILERPFTPQEVWLARRFSIGRMGNRQNSKIINRNVIERSEAIAASERFCSLEKKYYEDGIESYFFKPEQVESFRASGKLTPGLIDFLVSSKKGFVANSNEVQMLISSDGEELFHDVVREFSCYHNLTDNDDFNALDKANYTFICSLSNIWAALFLLLEDKI